MSRLPRPWTPSPIDSAGDVGNPLAASTTNVDVAPESSARPKKPRWTGRRAYKARKAARAITGGLQESVEAMTEVSQETTASAEQRKIDTAKEKLRKTEEAKLKREQEVQAARAKRIEKIKAEGGYLVHSDDELRPYRPYPRIYGERLFQKPVDKSPSAAFLELPLEIRQMIYSHALEIEEPIELWPDTGDMKADYTRRVRNKRELQKLFRTNSAHNLGLLRTCKQVNVEAAEIFYGKNEFRFSGLNGHVVAYAYATKIGRRNLGFMKSITFVMPFRSSDRGDRAVNWCPSNWTRMNELYDRMPFPYPRRTYQDRKRFPRLDFEDSWLKLAWMLAEAPRLKKITFLLPKYARYDYDWDLFPNFSSFSAFDDLVAAKPDLQVTIVRMFEDIYGDISYGYAQRPLVKRLKSIVFCHVRLAQFSRKGHWELAPWRYVDKDGEFVHDKALDASEDPLEMLPDIERLFMRAAYE